MQILWHVQVSGNASGVLPEVSEFAISLQRRVRLLPHVKDVSFYLFLCWSDETKWISTGGIN